MPDETDQTARGIVRLRYEVVQKPREAIKLPRRVADVLPGIFHLPGNLVKALCHERQVRPEINQVRGEVQQFFRDLVHLRVDTFTLRRDIHTFGYEFGPLHLERGNRPDHDFMHRFQSFKTMFLLRFHVVHRLSLLF